MKFSFFLQKKTVFVFYTLLSVIISLHLYFVKTTDGFTHYDVYVIFKQSFFHLLEGKNLYLYYQDEHRELFKYSPTFALFMVFFAYLPDWLGLILWNLLNSISLYFAVFSISFLADKIKIYILWFILPELITTLQGPQSNALLSALFIFAFSAFEKNRIFTAAFYLVLTVYIKLFGLVFFVLFVFYSQKIKFILYSFFWAIVLLLPPLLILSPFELKNMYLQWLKLLGEDHALSYGISVMGLLFTWFQWEVSKNIVLIFGLFLLLLPLFKIKNYPNPAFRILYLSLVLIWVVIFNHRAESPSFIIALCGVALWFFMSKKTYFDLFLVCLCFILTCLSPTDLFPRFLRENYVVPYTLKVLPCLLIYLKIFYELMFKTQILKQNENTPNP